MSDYWMQVGVSRDDIATEVAGNIEQAPYVLAEITKSIAPGTSDFDDFMDGIDGLTEEHKQGLKLWCQAILAGMRA